MGRIKSPQQSIAKQRRIGKWKEANPNATYSEVANEFNCTYEQARYAHQKFIKGLLDRKSPREKTQKLEDIMSNFTAEELFEKEYHKSMASLAADKNLTASERINQLDKLITVQKKMQQISLTGHMKRADSEVVASIIRRFKPDATDQDVLLIYKEEFEKCKISQL